MPPGLDPVRRSRGEREGHRGGNGLLTIEQGHRSPGDLELGLEVGDGLEGLGQLVGLEALDAFSTAGVDQRLALPRVERGLCNTKLFRERRDLLASDEAGAHDPTELGW